ncbi:Golgi-associated plant pathogenesis-related protein 1-like [Episyrphus balteatus]|uniref:Golgi-associated plant pathogenesis-related protein 1-like n=1 Tax=Episyrphus balteatus TaxID=286459 RepID=UPI0024868D3E|nr:Golgi-associated plant pathogenesis-related protein 1-like [Episyrphus balteatus]
MCFKLFCCCNHGDNAIGENNERTGEANPPVINQPILSGFYNLFVKECLDEHNRFRALHGVPMVTLNVNLSAYATEWARILADRNSVLIYRNEQLYGENLFVAREYNVDARTVVKSWYDEIKSYNFDRPEKVHGVDQFTQVVWMKTREIGVGIEKRGQNTWVVVNYDPKGNIPKNFEINVPEPIKKE